jgi:hypothetical protein
MVALLTVEVIELGTQNGPVVECGVAVYTEEHLFATPRMEVVLHHEVKELLVALPDLIDELRERDAARDQTLARIARLELAQTPVGVPDDNPGGDVPDPHCLLRHEGPFLDPKRGRSPLLTPLRPAPLGAAVRAVYVQRRTL